MQPSTSEEARVDPTWERLEDQIRWYEAKSALAQRTFNWLKIIQIVLGALIPFLAGFQEQLGSALGAELLPALLIAALGVIVVVLEGVQQLKRYQETWLTYRSTAEALKREKFLFLAEAGPYADVEAKRGRLAERVEDLIATEHAGWVATRSRSEERRAG